MQISSLSSGMTVYKVTRELMGNTTIRIGRLNEIVIKEVDPEGRWVVANWAGQLRNKFGPRTVATWRLKKPTPKGTICGRTTY